MKRFTLLLLALVFSGSTFAGKNYNALEGYAILEAGKNQEASQYFREQMEWQWEAFKDCKECNNKDKYEACPFCNFGIAVAEYRQKNYREAKAFLINMMNMEEVYYSSNPQVLGYAYLVATKSKDISFYEMAEALVKPETLGWSKSETKFFEDCRRFARKKLLSERN